MPMANTFARPLSDSLGIVRSYPDDWGQNDANMYNVVQAIISIKTNAVHLENNDHSDSDVTQASVEDQ